MFSWLCTISKRYNYVFYLTESINFEIYEANQQPSLKCTKFWCYVFHSISDFVMCMNDKGIWNNDIQLILKVYFLPDVNFSTGDFMSCTKFILLATKVHAEFVGSFFHSAPQVVTQLAVYWSAIYGHDFEVNQLFRI